MTIAVDAVSGAHAGSTSSFSFAHTIGTGAILIVFAATMGGTTTVTGVTYAGVAMTQVQATQDLAGAGVLSSNSLWMLHNPATGSNNVVVTASGTTSYFGAHSISYTGVVATSVAATHRTIYIFGDGGGGTGRDVTVTDSANGDMVVASCSTYNAATVLSAGGGMTSRRITEEVGGGGSDYAQGTEDVVATGASTVMTWTNDQYCTNIAFALIPLSATYEQEGYRWRNDDGSETTATWLAAQDTPITRAAALTTRLRVLIDTADEDPATAAMRLEYKEDSEAASAWRPVGAVVVGAMPAYDGTGQAAAVTNATITTAITPAKPSTVNAGDLLILQVLARNDNNNGAGPATLTDWTPFAGNPYGGTNNSRQSIYWRIAGAGEASQTVSVTCTGSTTNDLAMARIYRFTAANGFAPTPIEGITTNAGTASPLAAPTAVTPTGTNRRAVCFGAIASSDATIGSMTGETAGDWTEAVTGNSTIGGDGTLNVQTADASAGTAIQGGSIAFTLSTSAHWNTVGCCLVPVSHGITLAASANITASGEATTAQLTAPTSGSFGGGRLQDDENPADSVDLALNEYGEWEWCLVAQASVVSDTEVYEFRVTINGTPFTTYTLTPTWTIGSTAGRATKNTRSMGLGMQHGMGFRIAPWGKLEG